jgi:transmembrane sensor
MKKRRQDGATLMQEAQRWHEVLSTATRAQREEFADWLRRSPEHLRVFFRHFAVSKELATLDSRREVDLNALVTEVLSTNVIPFHGSGSTSANTSVPAWREPRKWRLPAAVAAGFFFAAVVSWFALQQLLASSTDYVTQTGELLRVPLPDGTVIELNTESHIRVAYTARGRDVTLVSGEALFTVRHDARRPFRVHVDATVIEDLGTLFSVYKRPDATTTLAVLEGNVQVSYEFDSPPSPKLKVPASGTATSPALEPVLRPARVDAGQAVRIVAHGQFLEPEPKNLSHPAAWTQQQLWFDGSSLFEIAAEFNRYNVRKIHVGSGEVTAHKRYSGNFNAYDPDSFVQFVQQDPTIRVDVDAQRVFIQDR